MRQDNEKLSQRVARVLNCERERERENFRADTRRVNGEGEGLALNYAAYAKRELSWQVIRETRESCISQRI